MFSIRSITFIISNPQIDSGEVRRTSTKRSHQGSAGINSQKSRSMFIYVYLPIQKEMIQLDVCLRLFDNEGYFNGKFKFISNVDGVSNLEFTQSKIDSKFLSKEYLLILGCHSDVFACVHISPDDTDGWQLRCSTFQQNRLQKNNAHPQK